MEEDEDLSPIDSLDAAADAEDEEEEQEARAVRFLWDHAHLSLLSAFLLCLVAFR